MSTPTPVGQPSDAELAGVLHAAVDEVVAALDALDDWGLAGTREGQHRCDLAADAAALAVLDAAGLGTFSEESGHHGSGRPLLVVIDPVDGSSNASRGLPFFAASLCVLDSQGPRVAVVANLAGCSPTKGRSTGAAGQLAGGPRYEATRGAGAHRDGQPIHASRCETLRSAIVGINGWPSRYLGWGQYRALGSAALELCAVAEGSLDGYCDVSRDGLAPWDYLGALLVCTEAGAVVSGVAGHGAEDLWVGDHRRSVVAAGTPELAGELLAARRTLG